MGLSDVEVLDLLKNVGNNYQDEAKIMDQLKVQCHDIGKRELSGNRQHPRKALGMGVGNGSPKKGGRGDGG